MEAETEEGDPRTDTRAFRRALGQFATGVAVVTTRVGEQLAGMTINSFASVSLDPPLVLCSIAKSSRSLALFQQAEHIAINVLASHQVALASTFASAAGERFAGVAWRAGLGGAPRIDEVAADFQCRIASRLDGGDHVILLCEVEHFARYGKPLLLYANGRFGVPVDYPAASQQAAPRSPLASDSLLNLLWTAFSRMSEQFQADREAEGMTSNQGRVLSCIERSPGASRESIARQTFVGITATDDAVNALLAAGLVAQAADRSLEVTSAGLDRVQSLRRRAAAHEARQLQAFAPEALDAVRSVLATLGRTP
jgi:4-hydroxyphenylacetate 3-hydroxylase, reductase component